MQHISGTDYVVAHTFSRVSYITPPPVDLKAIAKAQKGDTELLDKELLDCWQITRHNSSPIQTFPATPLRFRHIHIDIIGPLSLAKSFRYCLTATDPFSRWVEAWPMESITAEDVAQTLFACWISRFGSPEKITTDQGLQLESQLLKHLGMFTAFQRYRTTSYHPCSNGMIARGHRQLKTSLICDPDSSWLEAVLVVLLGIHSVFKEDLQSSSAEMVYGEPLRHASHHLASFSDK
ncbi:integrase catalytic domain-containing protein [Trichonephila clavata]|uniref:Integrase catalytic domain-containing protein n=1 Tax=Trichonephila clavata TaxID=2740835 RepID=A0A8X6GDG8_TRICU|nr:integrase catalytic domain-containing protein [Trichonephila clavata]